MAQQDIAPTDNGADSLVKIESNFTELYGKTDKITNASASAPASIDLAEDTDNGTNKITLTAPSAIASDKVITLPDETGTVITTAQKGAGSDIITGTDDAKYVTSKALADATGSKLGAAWTPYTPTTSALTVGNGTITARYTQIGKTVHAQVKFVLGSTSAIEQDAFIGLPVNENGTIESLGIARFQDASSFIQYVGWWRTGFIGYSTVYGDINATTPFTWAVGDIMWLSCTYEAA